MSFATLTPENFIMNRRQLSEELANSKHRYDLPYVNYCDFEVLRSFPNESVVRYRGIIQDMKNREWYQGRIDIRNDKSTHIRMAYQKYRDNIPATEGQIFWVPKENPMYDDRQMCVCVSMPGMNEWAEKAERKITNIDHHESSNELVNDIYSATSPIKSRFCKVFKIMVKKLIIGYIY